MYVNGNNQRKVYIFQKLLMHPIRRWSHKKHRSHTVDVMDSIKCTPPGLPQFVNSVGEMTHIPLIW